MSNLGFIGLGIMGRPQAGHLQAAGHKLFLNTRSKIPQELLDKGGVACRTPKDVASQADIIFVMVSDTPDVEQVLFGENGVAKGLSAGKIVVDMSTISPITTKDFAKRIEDLGCFYLDAPVSGGEVGARAATLTFMVGGREEIFEKVKPLFQLMGKTITLIGGNGDGQTRRRRTRSSSRSPSRPWAKRCYSRPRRARTPQRCARRCSAASRPHAFSKCTASACSSGPSIPASACSFIRRISTSSCRARAL